jgi:ATP diphosphatase
MPEVKVLKGSNPLPKNASVLDQISGKVDLMDKAIKLQSKAAEFGFDWPTIEPVFEKLQEEIKELQYELKQSTSQSRNNHDQMLRLQDELGDVLFCCMNLARFLKVDPCKALQSTNEKFERRFNFIEDCVAEQGKQIQHLSLEELDQLWDLAKEQGL